MTNWERIEVLDDALTNVQDAIAAMRESELDDDISDMLDDVEMALTRRRKTVYSDIEAHDDAEREQEYRDAFVGVL